MPRPFIQLTIEQFAERLRTFTFTRRVTGVHMHHTFRPRKVDYRGVSTIEGMFRFHTETNGWSDIAQHLSIAPDGTVWTGRDWNRTPASATGFSDGAFMFETIGDFDTGRETLEGAQRGAVVNVIALVQLKCGLPIESLHFHREFTNQKSCPGTGIRKADILAEVRQARERIASGARVLVGATPNAAALPMSRHASIHAASASSAGSRGALDRPFDASQLARAAATRGMDGEEGEVDCGDGSTRDVSFDRAKPRGFSAEDLSALRPHVINLRQGQFSGGGVFDTSKGDVDAIFNEHLPRAMADAKARGEKLKIVVWAHGGLVDEESGLGMASAVIPWWMKHHVYPIYFVWETGLFETITQLIKGRRELAARDIFDVTDRPIEELVRTVGGGKIWDGMKQSARRSTEPDGGALIVAEQLARFCADPSNAGHVELHAVGHSAGAIFHSHFIPATLALNPQPFETVSFLAPAIRVDEFLARLAPRLGAGIDALTMFTMRKDLERKDNCATLYRKSLLYLIHFALEGRRGEPILGLEQSIRDEPLLAEIFGLAGDSSPHEVIFSKTPQNTGRSATRAKSHGSFDNDTATMGAVLRRILRVTDDVAIEPFPANTARAVSFDAALERSDFAAAQPPDESDGESAFLPASVPNGAPSAVAGPSRLLRALCVGINEYPGSARLGGCVNDANDWARLFRKLQFERVDLLLDQDATQARLRQELRDLVRAGRPGDVLAFQYSGHGTFFEDQPVGGDEKDNQDEAIVPVDFQKGRFILDDELFEIFNELRDGVSLTCFFDCCHSGSMSRFALASMMREIRDLRDDEVKSRFIEPTQAMLAAYREERAASRSVVKRSLRSSESLKAVVFSACRDDEVALETGGRGVFTRRVSPMVVAAFEAGTTNEEFQRKIVAAFGASPSQNPALDGASRALARPLLRLGAPGVPSTPPVTPGSVPTPSNGNGDTAPTVDAWNTLLKSLYSMEPGALEQLVDEARQILSKR